jgi:hypothetical protein
MKIFLIISILIFKTTVEQNVTSYSIQEISIVFMEFVIKVEIYLYVNVNVVGHFLLMIQIFVIINKNLN